MWPPSRGHLSCSASVDVAPRDITFCPEARNEPNKSRERRVFGAWKTETNLTVEASEKEESGSKGEGGRKIIVRRMSSEALLYTQGPIPDTTDDPIRRTFVIQMGWVNDWCFCRSFRLRCPVGFYRFRPCRCPSPPSLLSLIRFLDHSPLPSPRPSLSRAYGNFFSVVTYIAMRVSSERVYFFSSSFLG